MVKVRRQSTNLKSKYNMKVPKIGHREIHLSREALKLLKLDDVNRRKLLSVSLSDISD